MSAQPAFDFDGETYEPQLDRVRLNAQLRRIIDAMKDGCWRSLATISELTGDPESSVSARLRDLRKKRFGKSSVYRMRTSKPGLWIYRLELSTNAREALLDA